MCILPREQRVKPNESKRNRFFVQVCLLALALLSVFLSTACARSSQSEQKSEQKAAPAATPTASTVDPPAAPLPNDSSPPPEFNASRAMQYVKEIVAFGPRPIGSKNHEKVENYIASHLKGDQVEHDDFTISTTEGHFPVHNIVAKFPGTRDGIIVIASHYDTNWPLRDINYVGANDGASSSALLLEIANQLRGKKNDGYSIWLLWDDAEESMRLPWYDPESLYGVKHLEEKWQDDGTLKNIKAFLLEDMIGDADLNILRDTNSTPWLEDLLLQAATNLGDQSHFYALQGAEIDDHIPFVQHGIPSADIYDPEYGYNDVFHHSAQDTVDKLSPKSLAIIGTVTLETVRLLNRR